MLNDVGRRVDAPFLQGTRQLNAATRRLGLETEYLVGGTGRQTKATMDATRQILIARTGDKTKRLWDLSAHLNATNEPARAQRSLRIELRLDATHEGEVAARRTPDAGLPSQHW